MKYRGILSKPMVLHTPDEVIIVPAGEQIEMRSSERWYHDVQDADIEEAVELMKEMP